MTKLKLSYYHYIELQNIYFQYLDYNLNIIIRYYKKVFIIYSTYIII